MRIAIGQDLTSLLDVGPIAVLLAYFSHYLHNGSDWVQSELHVDGYSHEWMCVYHSMEPTHLFMIPGQSEAISWMQYIWSLSCKNVYYEQ